MTSAQSEPEAAAASGAKIGVANAGPQFGLWIRELPFTLVLLLTVAGVAYTSFSRQPIIAYWLLLTPIIGLVCVGAGWRRAGDNATRLRLIWSQALHWLAFLAAMNLLLLPSVQRVLNADATGLAIFTLLALGAFTAGVHVRSWQVCLLGATMALGVPAIAWIENSAVILALFALAAVGVGAAIWWRWRAKRTRAA